MLRSPWTIGAADGHTGPLLVSVTEFRAHRRRDLPGICHAGYQLRRSWPQLTGAIGMWLWAEPTANRCGSVSVWQDEPALHRFISWPDHLAIVRRYRDRGRMRSTTWTADQLDHATIWRRARSFLSHQPGHAGQSP
jgi:hypothetical protein